MTITLNDQQYDLLLQCIHRSYYAYGEEYTDEEVYALNSELDNLMNQVKKVEHKPKEPLIKDEKIRKAVRAWWETIPNEITDKRIIYKKNQDLAVGVYTIYCGTIYPQSLEVGKMYTIIELCGVEDD